MDGLFACEPAAFVAQRNALVKQLKAAKQPAAAKAIAELRRPPKELWALNATAIAGDPSIEALATAVEQVRSAAAGGEMRAATADLRAAITDAAGAAAALSEGDAGPRSSDLTATLRTIIGSDEALDALRRGRMTALPAAGDLFGGPSPATGSTAHGTKASREPKSSPATAAAAETDAAARRQAMREVDVAAKALDRANATRMKQSDRVVDAERAQADAESAVTGLERQLQEARSAADSATVTVGRARSDLDAAEDAAASSADRLDRARQSLDALG